MKLSGQKTFQNYKKNFTNYQKLFSIKDLNSVLVFIYQNMIIFVIFRIIYFYIFIMGVYK